MNFYRLAVIGMVLTASTAHGAYAIFGMAAGAALTRAMTPPNAEQQIAPHIPPQLDAYIRPLPDANIIHESLINRRLPLQQINRIIIRGQNDANLRYTTYVARTNSQNQVSINRTIFSGLAYASASIIANKVLTHLTDKQWINETFFYDQEVLAKKKELLKITRERAIHEDNMKILTARVPLVTHDAQLSADLKKLITQETAKDLEAEKRQDKCREEYNKLKADKLGKK